VSSLSDILDDVDLVDWLDSESIRWKRTSSSDNIQLKDCPFCGDSKSRVYFSLSKKRGTCFHGDCPKGNFNLFSFAKEHLHTDSRGTIRHFEAFARGAGIRAAPRITPAVTLAEGWKLPASVALPTPEGHTHPFLINRQITLDTQAEFGLRWCEEGWFNWTGLDGKRKGMKFDKRILIPIADLDSTVQTFMGRATWEITDESEKRYLFAPTLPGSGRFLYGGHLVKGKKHLAIGEGPFDVMAIHQAFQGHKDFAEWGAVGSFGLTIGHGNEEGNDQLGRLRTLKRDGLESVTFLWDGEPGAYRHALKAGDLVRKTKTRMRWTVRPLGEPSMKPPI
jgi:DNA primase